MARLRRRYWILLALGATGVLSVVGLGVVLRSPWVEARLRTEVEQRASKALFERVQVERVHLTLLPPGLALDNLLIQDDVTGERIAHVQRVHAGIGVSWTGVGLGRVRIDEPRVVLHLDAKGKLAEFTRPEGTPPGPNGPLRRLPWSSLEVLDGQIDLIVPEGHVALTDLQVTPAVGTVADLSGRLDVAWRDFTDGGDLDLRHVALGPDVIDVPDLGLGLRALEAGGRARIDLAGPLSVDLALHSDLRELTPLLYAPRALDGTLDAEVQLTGTPTEPVLSAVVTTHDASFTAPGKVWPIVTKRIDYARADVVATPGRVVVRRAVGREDQGEVTVQGVLEQVDRGLGPRWELIESDIESDRLSLAAILRAVGAAPNPWVDLTGHVTTHLSGSLQPLLLEGAYVGQVEDFQVRQGPVDDATRPLLLDIPDASLSGTLSIYSDHLVMRADTLRTPRNRGRVVMDVGYAPQGPLDLRADLVRADLSDIRPLNGSQMSGRGRLTAHLRGPFNGLHLDGKGVLDGFSVGGIPYADHLTADVSSPDMKQLVLTGAHGQRGETRYHGNIRLDFGRPGLPMETDVVIAEGRVQDLVGMFVDLGDLVTGDIDDGHLSLQGPLNDLDGDAHLDMSNVVLVGERFERGEAWGSLKQGLFTLDRLGVQRGQDEYVRLRGGVGRAWALDMQAEAELDLARLDSLEGAGLDLVGRLSTSARLDNTLFEPAPRGTLTVKDVALGGQSLPDSQASFSTTDGVLTAKGALLGESVLGDLTVGLWGEQPYTVRATFDSLPVDRLYPVAADGQEVLARVSGTIDVSGHGGPTPGDLHVEATVPRVVLGWDRHTLTSDEAVPWKLALDGEAWTLSDVKLEGGPSRLAFTAKGTGGSVLAEGGGAVDADLLRAMVPGLTRAEGLLSLDLSTSGPRGAATTVVHVDLDAPLLRHDAVPAAFEDLKLRGRLTPDAYLLDHFVAEVGGGRIVGDARSADRLRGRFPDDNDLPLGLIHARDWRPDRYDLLARATNVQMQWVDDLPPAVGDAAIAFDGPADALLLHADVDITDMAFTERIDWEDWVVALESYLLVEAPPTDEPPWFGLDVDIEADRTVRLLNNVSDATASAELTLTGDTSRMGMTGRVEVNDGVVYLQDRPFDVMRGELRFDDPYSWDPLLDFDLRTDIQSRNRQYRVNYRIAGPYSAWTSRTISNPRLPQADINALLWFGVTADELEDMGELTNAVGLAAADFVFKDFVQNDYLGLGLGESALLERLPELDLNTGVNLRGEYSSEPRLLAKQRFSPKLSALLELNLIRDDHFVRMDWRADESLLLSTWWASRRREGLALPFSGALGVDVRWVAEFD